MPSPAPRTRGRCLDLTGSPSRRDPTPPQPARTTCSRISRQHGEPLARRPSAGNAPPPAPPCPRSGTRTLALPIGAPVAGTVGRSVGRRLPPSAGRTPRKSSPGRIARRRCAASPTCGAAPMRTLPPRAKGPRNLIHPSRCSRNTPSQRYRTRRGVTDMLSITRRRYLRTKSAPSTDATHGSRNRTVPNCFANPRPPRGRLAAGQPFGP